MERPTLVKSISALIILLMILIVIISFLISGCASTPTRPIVKRSQEIHYDRNGRYIGRTIVRTYKDGSFLKEHYDAHGKYIGRSKSK